MRMGKSTPRKEAGGFGIYSSFITEQDSSDLEKMKPFGDAELAYARIRLKAAQKVMLETEDRDLCLKWDQACRGWLQIILAFIDRQARRQAGGILFQMLFEEIHLANEKDKVS